MGWKKLMFLKVLKTWFGSKYWNKDQNLFNSIFNLLTFHIRVNIKPFQRIDQLLINKKPQCTLFQSDEVLYLFKNLQAADLFISMKCFIPGQCWNGFLQEQRPNRSLSITNSKETCERETIHSSKKVKVNIYLKYDWIKDSLKNI